MTLQTLRHANRLARLVLAWFVLSVGVAIASPWVHPQSMDMVCSSAGTMKLLVSGDDNTPANWGPLEVMSARILVEAEEAALAAANAQKGDLKAIKSGLQQMKLEAARDEVPRQGDEAFHEAIAQACGNSVLLDTVQRYWMARNGPLFERLGDYFEHPVSWQTAIAEHMEVMQAIEARDSSAARKAMQKHLKQAHKRYSASWRRAPAR